jgi:hypothetical protein
MEQMLLPAGQAVRQVHARARAHTHTHTHTQRREAMKNNGRFGDGEVVRKVVRKFPHNGNKPMAYYQVYHVCLWYIMFICLWYILCVCGISCVSVVYHVCQARARALSLSLSHPQRARSAWEH